MTSEVDIKQLAIVRGEAPAKSIRRRPRLLTRHIIPGALITGFAAVALWAAQEVIWPPTPVWVTPVLASQSTIQSEGAPLFQAAGWIEPRPTPIRVAALAPGVVERLLVVEDQPVSAGEAVAELVKADAQLLFDSAMADINLREAERREMQAALKAAQTRLKQPVHLQAALGAAEASLAEVATALKNLPFETQRAAAQLKFAEADYQGKLASKGAISGRAVQKSKSALESARAMLAELKGRTESLERQRSALLTRRDALKTQLELLADEKQAYEAAQANVAAADARLQQARVALAEAKLRLDRMTVRAPIDGKVYQLVAYPGTNLTGGMSPIADVDGSTVVTLYQPDSLQVRVDVRFEDIPKVTMGQAVQINNAALPAPISGHVLFISSEANIQKNTLEVKVDVDAQQAVLKPEMLVDVTFLAPKATEGGEELAEKTRIYLPQSLVHREEGGSYVWLADQSQGIVRRTTIAAGRPLPSGLIEITEGLSMGSRVVARGHEDLTDGQRIRVVSEDATATAAFSAAETPQPQDREGKEGR